MSTKPPPFRTEEALIVATKKWSGETGYWTGRQGIRMVSSHKTDAFRMSLTIAKNQAVTLNKATSVHGWEFKAELYDKA